MITGEALRVARENEGLTQKDVASAIGVSLRSIGNWERTGTVLRKHWPAIRRLFPAIDSLTVALDAGPRDTEQLLKTVREARGIDSSQREKVEQERLRRWLDSGRRPTPELPEESGDEDASPLERLYDLRHQLDLILRDLELDPDSTHSYPSQYREERERKLIAELRSQVAARERKKSPEPPLSPSANLYNFATHPPFDITEEQGLRAAGEEAVERRGSTPVDGRERGKLARPTWER